MCLHTIEKVYEPDNDEWGYGYKILRRKDDGSLGGAFFINVKFPQNVVIKDPKDIQIYRRHYEFTGYRTGFHIIRDDRILNLISNDENSQCGLYKCKYRNVTAMGMALPTVKDMRGFRCIVAREITILDEIKKEELENETED